MRLQKFAESAAMRKTAMIWTLVDRDYRLVLDRLHMDDNGHEQTLVPSASLASLPVTAGARDWRSVWRAPSARQRCHVPKANGMIESMRNAAPAQAHATDQSDGPKE
jgi:hypothetical protein